MTEQKSVALYRRSINKYFPSEQPKFREPRGIRGRPWFWWRALKRAGKDLTREGLIRAIESIHDHDLGLGPQLKLNYSAKEHKGFDHVIPTVVRGGRAVPFTAWSTAAPQ